jgi:hypothetical protein
MLVARKGSGVTLTSAVLLSGALLLSACEENDPVQPTIEGTQPAPTVGGAPDASLGDITRGILNTNNIYSDRLGQASVELSGDNLVEILSIPELPAGQYLITGHVGMTNSDRDIWTYVACFLRSDDANLGTTVTFIEEDRGGGVRASKVAPVAGHITVPSGSARVWLECQRQGQVGSPEIGGGGGGRTQIIAARVG